MKEIKNNELQERQMYVPASVKVTNVTLRSTILAGSNEQYENDTW